MNTKKIIFFDTETTWIESKWLIQLAYTVYTLEYPEEWEILKNIKSKKDFTLEKEFNKKIKSDFPIEIWAMAVHHLTEQHIIDNWIDFKDVFNEVQEDFTDAYLVAHNVQYDRDVLVKSWINLDSCELVDTFKLSYFLDVNPERYSLQYLRYFYELYEFRSKITAHDAMWDVLVLEWVFFKLLDIFTKDANNNEKDALSEFINITKKPLLLRDWKFWKYKWKNFEDVAKIDIWYLDWAYNKLILPKVSSWEDYDKNLKYTLEVYLWKI